MMDTFFEQIVPIRKSGKTWAAFLGIWFAALLLSFVLLILAMQGFLTMICFLLIAGVIYGAYKLSSRLSVEYEYIITNGTMDVDKIIAKSARKRVMSFDIANVDRLEKYNPNAKPVGNFAKTVIACDELDPGSYFVVVSEQEKGNRLFVFAPDERMRGAIVKFLPKFIANSAFK